jgi:tetratricopeptide (TPR) repeat protein
MLLVGGLLLVGGWYLYARWQGQRSLHDLTRRVDELLGESETDRAFQLCQEAVRWNAGASLAYSERGRVYEAKKDNDRASQDQDEAIRLDPRNALAFARRGRLYSVQGNFDRAFSDCDHAVQLDPKLARAYVNRALVLKAKKNLTQAIADMDEAIRLEPEAAHYTSRGEFYLTLDLDLALKDFDQSIQIKPNADAYVNRADAFLRKGDADASFLDRAVADSTEALKLRPTSASAYGVRGAAYLRKKDNDSAEADLTEAIRLDRQYALAYRNRGQIYLDQKKYEPAARDYQAAKDLKGDLWWYDQNSMAAAYLGLAKEQLDAGDTAEAGRFNDRSIALRDELLAQRPWWLAVRWARSDNYHVRGEGWEKAGNLQLAAASYQQASDEGNQAASRRLAELYETGEGVDKDPDKAGQLRKKADGQAMKRFTVPCSVAGYAKPYPLDVYVTTPRDSQQEDPLEDEARRLKEDHDATVPPAVRDSFKRLLKIARENNVSFPDLCVYALGKTDEGAKKQ